jgi:hypothetical protein
MLEKVVVAREALPKKLVTLLQYNVLRGRVPEAMPTCGARCKAGWRRPNRRRSAH